ncbi:hypothetical protein ASG40_19050 [Methylobacterium sp. Leaf399]|uniref:hypothetical protein n=1 Tax=Methylobacterium sp. Leaf399 TaxID=1736364 RepID=UPI0006FE48F4|nr:hypothetical protein [Methylobacterium sp. Leaf399]KQT15162.1 hypothetical protein ASG40_19050 [Methylobacterium sp. Leaf399]
MSAIPSRFEAAAEAGIITPDQAETLAAFYASQAVPAFALAASAGAARAVFDLAHVLWYAGALVVMAAMGLFSTLAFGLMGGPALTATALVYAAAFVAAGRHLWHVRKLPIPGGLLITCAVAMTPLAVYGIQESGGWGTADRQGNYRDFFLWIKAGWLPMEIATLAATALALRFHRFGFLAMVAAVTLWFVSMDIAVWIANSQSDWETRRAISLWFGLGLIVFAWAVDLRQSRADYAFWLHLAGIATFWGALTAQDSSSEVARALYALLNAGLVAVSIFLSRRVYALFGAIGLALYLGHLSHRVFADSLLFPFGLSLIGLAMIGAGLLYQRHSARIGHAIDRMLPARLVRLKPRHAIG